MLAAVFVSLFSCGVLAQSPAPAHKASAWKRYCHPNEGFCFKYPASWNMLGEVFDGKGVVVAPTQTEEQSLWDEITVAMVAPPPQGDEEGLDLNGVVEQAAAGMREAGQNFVTLQRQDRTVDHKPAQLLKAQYREKSSGRDWIEELVFIDGPDNEIYSVALKCAPQNLARLEPVLKGVLASWTLLEPEPPASDESTPQSPPPAKSSPQPQH
ncbi:MAG TPA: hypothetical protein VKB58_08250 [Terriglobales bacterium]|nr:hypothetical protein [Terriglobales bacterium]